MHFYAFPPRAPPGYRAPTVMPGVASGVHDVLLLLLLPLLWCCCCVVLLLLLLLLCLRYVLAADPREYGSYASQPPSALSVKLLLWRRWHSQECAVKHERVGVSATYTYDLELD